MAFVYRNEAVWQRKELLDLVTCVDTRSEVKLQTPFRILYAEYVDSIIACM